ncbi:hypothetical protein COO60DRAFT_1144502 [Scenedesmus sp. NREL 46B-D3]|nr:hypothetical protein COO60DRAFT_1144502 [Scenedesmus sp. NREL 46B-D3]
MTCAAGAQTVLLCITWTCAMAQLKGMYQLNATMPGMWASCVMRCSVSPPWLLAAHATWHTVTMVSVYMFCRESIVPEHVKYALRQSRWTPMQKKFTMKSSTCARQSSLGRDGPQQQSAPWSSPCYRHAIVQHG